MPKVAQAVLEDFGRAVKRQRSLNGWTLDQLAGRITPPPGKSFLSNIEKGKRDIGATTVGKLIRALSLDEGWIDRFLDADTAPEAEETREDREAERLIRLYERDDSAPKTGETLLMLLAEDWAQKKFTDPAAAYTALKGALQAADDLRRQGHLPSNASEQVQAVLRHVADLNDQGRLEDAGAALQDAVDRNAAEAETLFEAQLKQDRLRNAPAAAAKRLIARLRASAPPGGLFKAVSGLLNETHERGEVQGDPFDLALALELAKANHERAKKWQEALALNDLGLCHLAIGECQTGGGHLTRARNAFEQALKQTPRQRDPQNWAGYQNNLGTALRTLGERTADPALLRQAIDAHRAALSIRTREAMPMDWATSQNNLGVALQELGEHAVDPALLRQAKDSHHAALTVHAPEATPMQWAGSQNNLGLSLRWLAAVTHDAAMMDDAAAAYAACLTIRTRDTAPFAWAKTQWNLADLALARHALTPDAAHLATARHHLALAREVFAQDGNDHQRAECDRLQAQIDAA